MGKLFLVRHGLTRIDPNQHHSEWSLDPAGMADLEALAQYPGFAGTHRVVCSTERKAMLTAEAIVQVHGLPAAEPFAGLCELRKGGWVAHYAEAMGAMYADPRRTVGEGGETGVAALARFRAELERLVAEAEGRDLVVVSHATILMLYLAHLEGWPQVDPVRWEAIGFPDVAVVDLATMRLTQDFGAWHREVI